MDKTTIKKLKFKTALTTLLIEKEDAKLKHDWQKYEQAKADIMEHFYNNFDRTLNFDEEFLKEHGDIIAIVELSSILKYQAFGKHINS